MMASKSNNQQIRLARTGKVQVTMGTEIFIAIGVLPNRTTMYIVLMVSAVN